MDQERSSAASNDEQRQLDRLRGELLTEFSGRLSPAVVGTRFDAVVEELQTAPVRTYIPVLARRRVRQLLAGQPS